MKIQDGFSLKPLAPKEKAEKQDADLREAAKMYETHFLNEMVKAMRTTVHDDEGLMKANFAEKIFTEQLDQQYVDGWAKKGGVGLADMIYSQIKERYYSTTQKDFLHSGGMLPIDPGKGNMHLKAIPQNSPRRMEIRLEAPDAPHPLAQAPLAGKVRECTSLDDNWKLVKLDHGLGLTSELTFPGRLATIDVGESLAAGQKVGELDSRRPILAWNLDWSEG